MKKGLLLPLFAIILIGVAITVIWYISERGKFSGNDKDSFIPYNSAVVVGINPSAKLTPQMEIAFANEIRQFRSSLLNKISDTLIRSGHVALTTKVLALRVEGKRQLAFLYVMDNKDVLSRSEITDFLKSIFNECTEEVRKYDRHKIYTLKNKEEEIFYVVDEGMILVSDSELYIEDALKQFEHREEETEKPKYKSINKYFSPGAGINIFLNTTCFSEVLPLYVDMKSVSPTLNIGDWFRWSALDGDISESGVNLNGFMHYAGMDKSYLKALEGQQPRVSQLDAVIPGSATSFLLLNLSDLKAYLAAIEQYNYNTGLKEKSRKRKAELNKAFGMDVETDLKELLHGEFASVTLSFDSDKKQKEGVVVAYLKSGGLCTALVEKMLANHARVVNVHPDSYLKKFQLDRDKSFSYHSFPAIDFPGVYWGDVLGDIKSRYVLVVDNYLVFASSETAVKNFIRDYVHGSSVKESEWYRNQRGRLAAKYNMAYFSDISRSMDYYKSVATGDLQSYLNKDNCQLSFFTSAALQWSNENNMLYTSVSLGTDKVEESVRPHILWQTKLDAPVEMKPVPVTNHETGEQEILVQDTKNTVYLINDAGRVLWKIPVEGKINSDVYQVDVYKNRKLQYLFSTPSKIYLVDRNGNSVANYPMTFKSECAMGITMYDYDNDRNYRIFAPCADREVYLYDIAGKPIEGWDSGKSDKEIVSKVGFYRITGKDYIVFADRYRLYILDRRGNERVRVSTVFELNSPTDIYITRRDGKNVLAFANGIESINTVDFEGKVQTVKCAHISPECRMNVADIDSDGADNYILTNGNKLAVYQPDGKLLYEKIMEAQTLDFPYVYKFSGADMRIGLLDRNRKQMLLHLADATLSKGFPISGDSPFSITFSKDEMSFFLFAGANNGALLKYRVQR